MEYVILTADGSQLSFEYEKKLEKVENLLENKKTYRPISFDPTNKHKAMLITLLKKGQGGE